VICETGWSSATTWTASSMWYKCSSTYVHIRSRHLEDGKAEADEGLSGDDSRNRRNRNWRLDFSEMGIARWQGQLGFTLWCFGEESTILMSLRRAAIALFVSVSDGLSNDECASAWGAGWKAFGLSNRVRHPPSNVLRWDLSAIRQNEGKTGEINEESRCY